MSKESSSPAKQKLEIIGQKQAYKFSHEYALNELLKVNQEIDAKKPNVATLLTYLEDSEVATQSLFAAAKVRFLHRGMILSELMAALDSDKDDKRSWTKFYAQEVQVITQISEKSEQLCRTVWHRWLAAFEVNNDEAKRLIDEPGNIHEFSKNLLSVANGDSVDSDDEEPKSPFNQYQLKMKKQQKAVSTFKRALVNNQFGDANDDSYMALITDSNDLIKRWEKYLDTTDVESVVKGMMERTGVSSTAASAAVEILEEAFGTEVPFEDPEVAEEPEPVTV